MAKIPSYIGIIIIIILAIIVAVGVLYLARGESFELKSIGRTDIETLLDVDEEVEEMEEEESDELEEEEEDN